jgi:hypothetical protein
MFLNFASVTTYAPFGLPKRFLLLAGLFTVSIPLAFSSETPALIERPDANSRPTEISVLIWVVDIHGIDSAQQSFTADIVVVLRWKDSRLAHTGTGVAHYALDQIWNPRVSIANETSSVSRKLPESVDVDSDVDVLYRQRYEGAFTQGLRLNSFPFDKQTIGNESEHRSHGDADLRRRARCRVKKFPTRN